MLLRCLVCPPYKGSGLLIFSAGLGADRCLGWGWVLLRFAVFACTAPGRVFLFSSGSCALVAGGGCLRAGLVQVMPCRAACWCSGLGSRVRLSLLAVYCISGGRCPACGLLAAVWWGLLWLWLRLRGGDALRLGRLVQVAGVAPAPCLAPSGQNKKRLQPCGCASVVLNNMGNMWVCCALR